MAGSVGKMLSAFVLVVLVYPSLGAKLNAPKVLLPYYSSVIANVTLEVEYSPEESQVTNCYRWRSTRPEVAQVHLINSTDGECASSARVSAISKTPHQMTTVILVENKVTKEILRCNVIVSEIVRLEIETTTRLLYLEDSPEHLKARGYDSEGNAFSSLEGLPFEWSLVSDNEVSGEVVDAHNILRIKRFSESHYTTPAHIAPLEEHGLQGDMILVEGIRTGSAKCSMRLKDTIYKALKPEEVRIVVIANLMLSPPDAYVLKHAHVKYTVELLKQNSLKEILMPSPQYYLDVKDTIICTLETRTSVATALEMGDTEIVLKDRNIVMTEFFRQPSAMLHVVNPGFLAFVVLPTRKWILETDREYDIYIEIYDTDSHKIHPSDNVRVRAAFPVEYFDLLFSSENGTYHRVRTLIKGDTLIDGELMTIIGDDGTHHLIRPEVKGSQDVEIYDPISVQPSYALFPWDPASRCQHNFTAKATGGSGEYVWGSSDVTTATVNFHGQITTTGAGKTNVTAADAKNAAHTGSLTVHVLPPSALSFPPTRVEAAVGTMLPVPLVVSARVAGRLIDFTDCSQLPLNVTFVDSTVFDFERVQGEQKPPERGCTLLHFHAIRQGHTEVTVTYQTAKVFLQTSITIAAYNPLKPVDPELQAVVAVASSKEVVFQGGPQPWVLDSSKFLHSLAGERSDQIAIQQASLTGINNDDARRRRGGIHTFNVLCKDFGEQTLTLSVGNGVTAKNQFPVTETASIKVVCARPVELHLQPILTQDPSLPPCPVTHETHLPMPVHCEKDLHLQVSLTDSSGRRFDNFSSLELAWSVSSSGLAALAHPKSLKTDVLTSDQGVVSVRSYQTLRPYGKTGTVVVTATISSYKQEYLRAAGVSMQERVNPRISKSLELLLVEEAVIAPDTVSIFNHPSNKVTIEVEKGSGYFHLAQVESQVLKASYSARSKAVLVNPLKEGTQSFTVYDLCLEVDSHPTATIYVSGVGNIQVTVIDKVEVQKEVQATVQVLDAHGHPLLSSFFALMGLQLAPASDFVTLRPVEGPSGDHVSAQYTVHGATVGHTSLTATARLPNGQVIYSAPKPIEVFPPLRLDPKNITLIVGAKFQVMAVGGPQPQSTVQFSIVNDDISSVSSSGLLTALSLGATRIVGKAVGVDPVTGESVVYSQDDAVVNVVPLRGIRIYAPLSRLQTGTRMPVYAMGVTEHETPFSFGSSIPPLTFTWSVNSREVLHLESVYHGKGVKLGPEDRFAQQVVAEETGHVTVSLVVRSKDGSNLQLSRSALRDDVQIQVFDKLQLTSPSSCDGQIRLTPNTETVIKTNRDVAAVMSYAVVSQAGGVVVRVGDSGQLLSGPIPGNAVVHVTAQEEYGLNQTLVFLVKVKPVSYLMLNLDTTMRTSGALLSAVPVGATLQFSVSFHDDVGETFYATSVQLGIRCSRYDLLHVSNGASNNSLVVRAAEEGQTTLKVWDKRNPWVADYISLPVTPAITPAHAVLALGSTMCFTSSLVTTKGDTGEWHSEGGAVQVDTDTGVGRAVAVGQSILTYAITADIITNTQVSVKPVEKIEVRPTMKYLTTNPDATPPFIPVSFTAPAALKGNSCGGSSVDVRKLAYEAPVVPFHCQLRLTNQPADVAVADVLSARPVFDATSGEHGCRVTVTGTAAVVQAVSTLQTSVEVSVTLPAAEGQPEVRSEVALLDLLPAFHVHSPELHLTNLAPLALLQVASVPKVVAGIKVTASDPTLLEVLTPESDPQTGSVVLFPVRLRDSLSLWERETLDLHLEVSCQRTGQRHTVPISVKLLGPKPNIPRGAYRQDVGWGYLVRSTLDNYQSWFVLLIIILATGAAVLVGYHAVIGPRYKASATSNVFLNQSSTSQPSTPHAFLQPTSPGSPRGSASPTRLWSVPLGQQQESPFSPYKRSPYTSFTKS